MHLIAPQVPLADGVRASVSEQAHDQIVLELTGSEADRGMPLANLESFIDQLVRGLRAFDRHSRLERGLKSGRPGKRDELVTAFRVVDLRAGSTTITLEPEVPSDGQMFPDASTLAMANFDDFLAAVEGEASFDADAAAAIGKARRCLGAGGRIRVVRKRGKKALRRVEIDERVVERLEERAERPGPRQMRVSGRLHLIDVEPPYKVGIRASDGTDWLSHYPAELEELVTSLLGKPVWVKGVGELTGAQRGSLEITEIHAVVGGLEQTEMFSVEPLPIAELMARQGISGPTPTRALSLPSDLSDEEVEDYLAALLDE